MNETKNNTKINTIHTGIKCNLCGKKPIIGIRYKCSKCEDFNLCEECEEKNYRRKIHKHYFIILRDIEEENDKKITPYNNLKEGLSKNFKQETPNKDDNDIMNESYMTETKNDLLAETGDENYFKDMTAEIDFNQFENNDYNDPKQEKIDDYQISNEDNNNLKYSYFVDQKEFLKSFYQNTISSVSVNIRIQNNGIKNWTRNTKLCCDKTSELKCDEIELSALAKNKSQSVECKFNRINELEYGKYTIFLNFVVDNIIYGEKIKIVLNCLYNEEKEKISDFRRQYNLSLEDASDEIIKEYLKKNNWNFEKTFSNLFESEANIEDVNKFF